MVLGEMKPCKEFSGVLIFYPTFLSDVMLLYGKYD